MMIVTELMRRRTIQKYLWSTHPLIPDLKLSISFALDICRAMEFLHANGIIHRDLKPSNLLLFRKQEASEGTNLHIRVMVAYATAKNVRPSLENIPKDIIPLLESFWAEDPKDRPEFMEVIDYLSNFYQELCSEEAKPSPKVIETADNDMLIFGRGLEQIRNLTV